MPTFLFKYQRGKAPTLCNGAITKNSRGTKQTFTLIINQPHAVFTLLPRPPSLSVSLSLSILLSIAHVSTEPNAMVHLR